MTRRRDRVAARLSPDAWALLILAAAVIAANLIYLLGFSDPNPLGIRTGLGSLVVPGHLEGQSSIDPNTGFVSQALSHLGALRVLGLHLPWWNPYEGTGAPLLGETQSAAFFAPSLLTAIANGQIYEHVLLEFAAGASTYLLLRRLTLRWVVCVAGGIAFALNGTFAWFSHAPVNPIALAPMLLLGIEHAQAAARDGRGGGWWLMAVAGALSVYAGFPETAYIDALLAGAWLIWRVTALPGAARGRFALKLGLGALVGTLLAAPMLVAMLDYLAHHADLGQHGGTILDSARLPPGMLPQLILPYVYGPIFAYAGTGQLTLFWTVVGGYLPASLLGLALLGVVRRDTRALSLILLAFGVLVFARIYGQPPLLGDVLGVLPGMSRIAFFRYAPPALELTVIILAALGLDGLAREHRARGLLSAGAVAAALVLAAAIGARPVVHTLGSAFAGRPFYWGSAAWGLIVAGGGLAVASLRPAAWRIPLLAAVVALDALAMFVVPTLSAPRAVVVDTTPVAYLQRHLGTSRFFTLGPLSPNYGSYFGLGELNANDIPVPQRFAGYVRSRLDPYVDPTLFVGNDGGGRSLLAPTPEHELLTHLAGYRAAAVRYVLTSPGQTLPQSASTFTLVFRSQTASIYRLAGSQPYFTAAGCRLSANGRDSARLSCPAPTTLIRRETYFPGWSATVDGRPAAISPHDGLFEAVTIPAGTHTVRFGFAPPGMAWGGLGLLAGALALLGAALRRLSARRAGAGAPERGARPSR